MSSDPRTWIGVLRNSHERLVTLAEPLTSEQLREKSYCTDWSIAQVLSHLGSGAEIGTLTLAASLDGGGELDRDAFPPIWDAWNNRTPEQQAADCLTSDEEHVRRLEQLTDAELDGIRLSLFGMDLDAAGLVGMRLGEHAVHTWDVAASLDPAAAVAPDATALLIGNLQRVLRFAGKPAGDSFRVRIRTTDPDGDYLLTVADPVSMTDWTDGEAADGEIRMPAEALLRLVYGRLDAGHTPAGVSAEGVDLDRLRKVFPGF